MSNRDLAKLACICLGIYFLISLINSCFEILPLVDDLTFHSHNKYFLLGFFLFLFSSLFMIIGANKLSQWIFPNSGTANSQEISSESLQYTFLIILGIWLILFALPSAIYNGLNWFQYEEPGQTLFHSAINLKETRSAFFSNIAQVLIGAYLIIGTHRVLAYIKWLSKAGVKPPIKDLVQNENKITNP